MTRIIEGSIADGGRVVDDVWTAVDDVEALEAIAPDVPVVVSRELWSSQREHLVARGAPLALRLEGVDDPADIAGDLPALAMVAIDFPKFTDGRGYSIARLLRERHGYRGRLRAVGDVLRDQIFYMLRCGFDSFAMRHEDHVESALAAYRDFTEAYQTSVDRRLPLFARRGADQPAAGSRWAP